MKTKYFQKLALLFLTGLIFLTFKPQSFEAYSENIPGTDLTLAMTPVEGGIFQMGNNEHADEQPLHKVKVSDFWMGTYEITWEQYEAFLQRNKDDVLKDPFGNDVAIQVDGVARATTPYLDMSYGMGKKGYPVINVTQYAAMNFCKWLSAKTGHFYRLPTEAEWEYACRAGSSKDYAFGNSIEELEQYAWYNGNSGSKYHQVGTKAPNKLGLYDMHGNVAEWTMDQYTPQGYLVRQEGVIPDPWVKPTTLYPRTVRGGSWQDDPAKLRASARVGSTPDWKRTDPQIPKSKWWHTNAPHVGFRIVRPRIAPTKEEIKKYWPEPIDDY